MNTGDWKTLFEHARARAREAHGRQRYGDRPYEHHLRAVVAVLERFGASLDDPGTAPLLVAAWLHDSLEDTALDKERLEAEFGAEVGELVWRVTDEPGRSRNERKPATYRKTGGSESAIVLKLADRIANVEASAEDNPGLLRMYRREHAEFAAALRPNSGGEMAARMWEHLDRCFARADSAEDGMSNLP